MNKENNQENSQDKKYRSILDKMCDDKNITLRSFVAEEALEHEDIKIFFSDLLTYGCQSGMIGSLIMYTDTHKFFDQYYHEIEDVRFRLMEDGVLTDLPDTDMKNYFAWLAFEETAREIAEQDLNIEI